MKKKTCVLAIYLVIMSNETLPNESSSKKWFNDLIDNIKRCEEENTPVHFRIEDITVYSFRVKTCGLYAFVSFSNMPWKYENICFWDVIFSSIIGKTFTGQVFDVKESPLNIIVRADPFQFDNLSFDFKEGETYTAIILEKTNTSLQIDFGYGFGWERGSLVFKIGRYSDDDEVDLFPLYNSGEEFDAVYVGKSLAGNDRFCHGDTLYFSEEHSLSGQKVWAVLERAESDFPCFQVLQKYYGELVLNEEDESGVPFELLQKTVMALPNGQNLWCKIVGVTPNGILQLKWLLNDVPSIENFLAPYLDTTALTDTFLTEEKKELIDKMVWCEVFKSSDPKIFKVENQYTGTVSMDTAYYPDTPLSLIINTLSKISDDQQIFCKIRGIYPDETLKLQWIAHLEPRSKKLSFPNKFSQKIDLEETKLKKKKTEQETEKQEQKSKIKELNEQYIGKTLLLEAKKSKHGDLLFWIDEKFIGKIVVSKANYPKFLRKIITNLLHVIPDGQNLLCRIQGILPDYTFVLRWMLEDDPIINELQKNPNTESLQIELNTIKRLAELKQQDSGSEWKQILQAYLKDEIERRRIQRRNELKEKKIQKTTLKQELNEQYIGKTLLLEAKKSEHGDLLFLIDEKFKGKIVVSKANYPKFPRKIITNVLDEIQDGQNLLCRIQDILPDYTFVLRWMLEEDTVTNELLQKISNTEPLKIELDTIKRLAELKEKRTQPTITKTELKGKKKKRMMDKLRQTDNYSLGIGVELTGKIVQAKIISIDGNEPCCLTADGYKGYLPIASHLYRGLARQIIKKAFHQLSKQNVSITCQIIGVRPDSFLRLKWMIDSDPLAEEIFLKANTPDNF